MRRKHKQYSKPKRPFDKQRIEEEAELKKNFGLKNKKEIWKAEAKIKEIREKAKSLISASGEEKNAFFDKLKRIGFNVSSISGALSLDKSDYMKRRFQTVVGKKFSIPLKGARQLIVHKKVLIDRKVINVPSYIVPMEIENKISLKSSKNKKAGESNA